jgi:hypothetical protein
VFLTHQQHQNDGVDDVNGFLGEQSQSTPSSEMCMESPSPTNQQQQFSLQNTPSAMENTSTAAAFFGDDFKLLKTDAMDNNNSQQQQFLMMMQYQNNEETSPPSSRDNQVYILKL